MKEYENKRLEEHRCEDYLVGRKGDGEASPAGGLCDVPSATPAQPATKIFVPSEVTPVVPKSILKKKRSFLLQSHGYMNNEWIDKVGGFENRMNRKVDSFKASKIDGLAAEGHRNIVFESAVKDIKGNDMENIMDSQIREVSKEVQKVTINTEIEKAAPRGKSLNLAYRSKSSKDEDNKRIKLAKANGGGSKTSVKDGLMSMSTGKWTNRAVKIHAVGVEVRGSNCSEWKGGVGEKGKSVHGKDWRDGHGAEQEGRDGGSLKKLVLRSLPAEESNILTMRGLEGEAGEVLENSLTVGLNESVPVTSEATTAMNTEKEYNTSTPVYDSFAYPNINTRTKIPIEDSVRVATPSPRPVSRFPPVLVLTREGYYTIPALSQLTLDTKGQCLVTGFTVGREGYGNIHYPGTINVANLNLDATVFIRHKEVIVYPDNKNEPPLGEGLNRSAQITLDNVWPLDKSSGDTIRSPNRLKNMSYEDKLERASNNLGARFIDYRPETGSWVFEVCSSKLFSDF